jgi:type VI secretion system protein ImpF
VISLKRYREGVLRDFGWLLNAKAHFDTDDVRLFGEAAESVLNFGIPDLCGCLTSGLDLGQVEALIVQAVERFEPRIMPNTLKVKAIATSGTVGPSVLAFEIRADLWANPMPEQLYFKTQIDMETGQCVL